MEYSKITDEIFGEMVDELFPNTEHSQYYGKFVEIDEEILNKFNSIPLVNHIKTEDLKKILSK